MLIDNDVDSFFTDDLTVEALYTPDGGEPSATHVIFDRDYIQSTQFGESAVETREIWITVKTSDYPAAKQEETVVIDSITYYIINPQPSIGISRIQLSKDLP